jgi:hypothetical protein
MWGWQSSRTVILRCVEGEDGATREEAHLTVSVVVAPAAALTERSNAGHEEGGIEERKGAA